MWSFEEKVTLEQVNDNIRYRRLTFLVGAVGIGFVLAVDLISGLYLQMMVYALAVHTIAAVLLVFNVYKDVFFKPRRYWQIFMGHPVEINESHISDETIEWLSEKFGSDNFYTMFGGNWLVFRYPKAAAIARLKYGFI